MHARHAVAPRLIAFLFKRCFNMKYLHYINTKRRLTLLASCEPWQHVNVFFNFLVKGHKIGEILALLTTELSSYKICKVGMLFCIQLALI